MTYQPNTPSSTDGLTNKEIQALYEKEVQKILFSFNDDALALEEDIKKLLTSQQNHE